MNERNKTEYVLKKYFFHKFQQNMSCLHFDIIQTACVRVKPKQASIK